jgi:hypothetical protein
MAVSWTFRVRALCRHVRREFLRNALPDFTPITPATACHHRNDVETYSRFTFRRAILLQYMQTDYSSSQAEEQVQR